MHDIWYKKDASSGVKYLQWAALRLGDMKLLQGSGAKDWELYNVTADGKNEDFVLKCLDFVLQMFGFCTTNV